MSGMRIGPLASAAGCTVETVRFYEREGLLRRAARTSGNYRLYGVADLTRLRFIRRCRSLDMMHEEIRNLLAALDSPRNECGRVNNLLDEHIGHVEQRLEELAELRRDLIALRHKCSTVQPTRHCGILQALSEDGAATIGDARGHVHRTHG